MPVARLLHRLPLRSLRHRLFSTSLPPPPPPQQQNVSKLEQIASKLPKRLRPYANRFIDRPISHVTSFLLLHEITAIVPLGGLFWLFHYTHWTPPGLPGEWIASGVEKFGNYARKKGWERFNGDKGARILFEIATAYAVVKATLPLRIGLSLWATPWFARMFVVPIVNLFNRRGKFN
ncbi:hypothetical protein RUND412_006989 [Rhizina undulata]